MKTKIPVQPEDMELLKEKFKPAEDTIRPDDSRVVIAQMQFDGLKALSTDNNRAFSQIHESEKENVSKALVWAESVYPSITEQIQKMYGIEIIFQSPILKKYIDENIKISVFVDRKREGVYLEGLRALQPKGNSLQVEDNPRRGIMQRLF